MDPTRFDQLAKVLAASEDRRGALVGAALGALAGPAPAAARPTPKHGRKPTDGAGGADRRQGGGDGQEGDVGPAVCHRLGKKCNKQRGDRCCGRAECRGGTCRCRGTRKGCHGRCIPATDCCDSAECGGGATCQDGQCLCPSGEKDCAGRCIPAGDCCSNADCSALDVKGTCTVGVCVAGGCVAQVAPVGGACAAPEGGTDAAVCQANGRCCVPSGGFAGRIPPGTSCNPFNCCSFRCFATTAICTNR